MSGAFPAEPPSFKAFSGASVLQPTPSRFTGTKGASPCSGAASHKGARVLEGNKVFQTQARLWASWGVAQGKCPGKSCVDVLAAGPLVEGCVDVLCSRAPGQRLCRRACSRAPGRNRTKEALPSVRARGSCTKPSIEE